MRRTHSPSPAIPPASTTASPADTPWTRFPIQIRPSSAKATTGPASAGTPQIRREASGSSAPDITSRCGILPAAPQSPCSAEMDRFHRSPASPCKTPVTVCPWTRGLTFRSARSPRRSPPRTKSSVTPCWISITPPPPTHRRTTWTFPSSFTAGGTAAARVHASVPRRLWARYPAAARLTSERHAPRFSCRAAIPAVRSSRRGQIQTALPNSPSSATTPQSTSRTVSTS